MKLNFFSITRMIQSMKTTITRFPLASITALLGTIIGLILLHNDGVSYYSNILLTLILAFPLSIAIVLFGEQQLWKRKYKIISNSVIVIFSIIYYLLLPENLFTIEQFFLIRYFMWACSFIMLVTFIPFLHKEREKIDAFWQYNRIVFSSLALTILYALFIQIGLSIALSSVKFLFNLGIKPARYMELWIIVVGIFSTTFFLSRIPKNISELQEIDFYPRELRLFSQYILVPLVTIYFLILYAYVAKILIIWDWPESVLAYMILGFSFLGVLTYISLYPLKEKIGWIKKACQMFYLILIPQIGMLFWTLWFRISQYGITEKRYLVFVFGLWLLGIGIYFLFSKKKDLRFIPITLSAIALICSFGPWGAFTISKKNQTCRLEKLLLKTNILVNNKIKKSENQVTFDNRKEISAIISYLIEVHGVNSIQSYFNQDLTLLKNKKGLEYERRNYSPHTLSSKIVEEFIGFSYVTKWQRKDTEKDYYFSLYTSSTKKQVLDISKYDYLAILKNTSGDIGEINDVEYRFEIDTNNGELIIFKNNVILTKVSLRKFLDTLLKQYSIYEPSNFHQDEMKVVHESKSIKLTLYLSRISGRKKDNKCTIEDIEATLLFSL